MSFLSVTQEYFSAFLDFIYPQFCSGCEVPLIESETHICMFCQHNLFITEKKHTKNDTVLLRFAEQPVSRVISLMRYSKKGSVKEIINKIKYFRDIPLGYYLGQELGRKIIKTNIPYQIDYIIPVPLHPKKLRKRGYNQAEIIAQGVSSVLHSPICTDTLLKKINNNTQTKKGRISRWKNTEVAYQLQNKNAKKLKGKNILLIDDVLTSGATLTSCIKELSLAEVGMKMVGVLATAENTH